MSDDSKIKKYIEGSPKIIGWALLSESQLRFLTSEKINEVLRQYYQLIIEGKTNGINAINRITLDRNGFKAAVDISKRTPYTQIEIVFILLALVWCAKDGKIPQKSLNPGKEVAKKLVDDSKKTWIQKLLDSPGMQKFMNEIGEIGGQIFLPIIIVGGILAYVFIKPYLKN